MVGLINIQPAEISNYNLDLAASLCHWSQNADKRFDTQKSDCVTTPDHKFKSCGFIGIGAWNYINLTLVSEQGLATQLSYMGKVSGQNYYHAYDLCLVLPNDRNDEYKELIDKLEDLQITYYWKSPRADKKWEECCKPIKLANGGRIYRKFFPVHLHHIFNGEIYGLMDLTLDSEIAKNIRKRLQENDLKADSVITGTIRDLMEKGNFKTEAVLISEINRCFTRQIKKSPEKRRKKSPNGDGYRHHKNIILEEIKKPLYRKMLDDYPSVSQDLKDDEYRAEAEKYIKGLSRHEKGILEIYQLKFNGIIELVNPDQFQVIIYLLIIDKAHEAWSDLEESERPTFIRPFLSSGFFDCIIMMRGRLVSVMESIINRIRFLKVKDAYDVAEKYGLKNIFKAKLRPESPLFHLTYSITGIPFDLVKRTHRTIDIIEEHHLNGSKCLFASDPEKESIVLGQLRKLKRDYDGYNLPKPVKKRGAKKPNAKNKANYMVVPSTLVSLQTGKTDFVVRQLKQFSILINNLGMTPPMDGKPIQYDETGSEYSDINFIKGRYDLELFQKNRKYLFGDFVFIVQLAKRALFRSRYFGRKRENDNSFRFKNRQLRSPLLEIKSKISTKSKLPKPDFERYKSYKDRINVHSTQILSPTHIKNQIRLLEGSINKRYPDLNAISDEDVRDQVKQIKSKTARTKRYFNGTRQSQFKLFPQTVFKNYLVDFFGSDLSIETIESFVSMLYAINYLLTAPLTFHFFVDIIDYIDDFLRAVFSFCIKKTYDADVPPVIFFWNLKTGMIEEKKTVADFETNTFVGFEGWFVLKVDLIQKIISQRQLAIPPNHDRNHARLPDLRLLHTKKIVAISWLVNSVCKSSLQGLEETLLPELHLDAETKTGIRNALSKALMDLPAYLPFFSNRPDAILDRENRSISLNSRQLTNSENIIFILHEIGHIIYDLLLKIDDDLGLIKDDPQRSPRRSILTRSGDNSPLSLNIDSYLNKTDPQPYPERSPQTNPDDENSRLASLMEDRYANGYCSDKITRSLDDIYHTKKISSIWEEVLADLYLFKTSYFGLYFDEDGVFKHESLMSRMEGVKQRKYRDWDFVDDFITSWVFQLVRLPKIQNVASFMQFFIRIVLEVGLLKYGLFQAESNPVASNGSLAIEQADEIWDEAVLPFLQNKFLPSIRHLSRLSVKRNGWRLRGYFWDYVRQVDFSGRDKNKEKNPLLHEFLNHHLRQIFNIYFGEFAIKRQKNLQFAYIDFLCSPKTGTIPFFKNPLFKGNIRDCFFSFRDGICMEDYVSNHDQKFSSALQLAACTNLLLSAQYKKISLRFTNGYTGFDQHANQQHLEKVRRLIGFWLWSGAMNKITDTYVRIERFREKRKKGQDVLTSDHIPQSSVVEIS